MVGCPMAVAVALAGLGQPPAAGSGHGRGTPCTAFIFLERGANGEPDTGVEVSPEASLPEAQPSVALVFACEPWRTLARIGRGVRAHTHWNRFVIWRISPRPAGPMASAVTIGAPEKCSPKTCPLSVKRAQGRPAARACPQARSKSARLRPFRVTADPHEFRSRNSWRRQGWRLM